MDATIERVVSANVLGLIEGSDPELKDEVVIYTAHHDHLGIGTPNEEGDVIYNGAMDNASGVSQLMAIAQAILAMDQAPRRSTLFALVGAEEQGLLGSKYYAAHPTFPAGKIAANINYDGGNIWGETHDVTFVGLGKSSIDDIVEGFAAEQGRVVKPDQFPDRVSENQIVVSSEASELRREPVSLPFLRDQGPTGIPLCYLLQTQSEDCR